MAEFTQDFFTSRRNNPDGDTYVHQLDRLWYDSNTNTIRIGNGLPGGIIVSGGGAGAETDPIFVASPAYGITAGDITNWDTWLTSPANGITSTDITNWDTWLTSPANGITGTDITNWDALLTAPSSTITNTDISNWDTAFGWGDHSLVGYALTADINLEGGTVDQVLVKQSGTDNDYVWEDLNTYEPKYIKEIDDASVARTTYLGEAAPNSLPGAAVWRIQEIIFDNKGGVDSVRFAGGVSTFTFTWTGRLGYTYS